MKGNLTKRLVTVHLNVTIVESKTAVLGNNKPSIDLFFFRVIILLPTPRLSVVSSAAARSWLMVLLTGWWWVVAGVAEMAKKTFLDPLLVPGPVVLCGDASALGFDP